MKKIISIQISTMILFVVLTSCVTRENHPIHLDGKCFKVNYTKLDFEKDIDCRFCDKDTSFADFRRKLKNRSISSKIIYRNFIFFEYIYFVPYIRNGIDIGELKLSIMQLKPDTNKICRLIQIANDLTYVYGLMETKSFVYFYTVRNSETFNDCSSINDYHQNPIIVAEKSNMSKFVSIAFDRRLTVKVEQNGDQLRIITVGLKVSTPILNILGNEYIAKKIEYGRFVSDGDYWEHIYGKKLELISQKKIDKPEIRDNFRELFLKRE